MNSKPQKVILKAIPAPTHILSHTCTDTHMHTHAHRFTYKRKIIFDSNRGFKIQWKYIFKFLRKTCFKLKILNQVKLAFSHKAK